MKYTNTLLGYEEASIMDNLNCKIQAHARVCKENKLEEKSDAYWNNFAVNGASLNKGSYRKSGEEYQDDILKYGSP